MGPISCLTEEGPEPFTTQGTCFLDETRECTECDGGDVGIQACTPEGRWGECRCPGCTVHPDCTRCTDCFEHCMCQTPGVSESTCRSTCEAEDGGADAGDAGDAGEVQEAGGLCVPELCDPAPALPLPVEVVPCCADNECGYDISAFGCMPTDQPGELDPECDDFQFMGFFTLQGCCRPDGTCGVFEGQFFGFGCMDSTGFVEGEPAACGPTIR